MTYKLNLITLALLTAGTGAIAEEASSQKQLTGYRLDQANIAKVKFNAWQCKRCPQAEGIQGQASLGSGYNTGHNGHSANAMGSDKQWPVSINADLSYQSQDGYRVDAEANNLGMDASRATLTVNKAGRYALALDYRTLAHWDTDNALTPYLGIGSNYLYLPENWVTASTTAEMTALNSALSPLSLSLKREQIGMTLSYSDMFGSTQSLNAGASSWQTYLSFRRETKTGLQTSSGSFFDQSMMLASPVDYQTDRLNAGITAKGNHWYSTLDYSGSMFNNRYNMLQFDNAFVPTFGAQSTGVMALAPDNDAHTVTLSGGYHTTRLQLQSRAYLGQMRQDDALISSGYHYPLPQPSLENQVDIQGADFQARYRINRDLRLKASYDLYDRDNRTQILPWQQISIDPLSGKVAYNTPYDSQRQQIKLAADYRLSAGVKLDTGYDYRQDTRSYSEREETDEHKVWASMLLRAMDDLDLRLKASHEMRDGSRFEASALTSSEDNTLLLRYNLADRNRTQAQLSLSYSLPADITLDSALRYAIDDYRHTAIGLTEAEDISWDISANWQASEDLHLSAFYGAQRIDSRQHGAISDISRPSWHSDIEDRFQYVGTSVRYDNLLADKLSIGLDYQYADSRANTQVTQGLHNGPSKDYGRYQAINHSLSLYGQYHLSSQTSVKLDYRYERYQDTDPATQLSPDAIWNVLSFGQLDNNYQAQLLMFTLQYRF